MKIAFFVHYFPPLNSTGSRRVESFAKYLSRDGHDVVVVSTKKSRRDGPLTEIVPSYVRLYQIDWRGRVFDSRHGQVGNREKFDEPKRIHWTRRLKQALMRHFGQTLDSRIGFAWGIRSRKLDQRVVQELSSADLFVSSFPPWPAHLAAMFAQKRFGKPWVADYRDQFSGNHIMNGGWISDQVELAIDRALLSRADACTVISEPMQTYYEAIHSNVKCIENGYDGELFVRAKAALVHATNEAGRTGSIIRYLGTITRDRIPYTLLEALSRLATGRPGSASFVTVEFYGDSRLLEDYVRQHHPILLEGWVEFKAAIPYAESIKAMLSADALFFIETSNLENLSARGILTTKLFEYLASGRLIIAEIDEATLAASYIRKASFDHVVTRDIDAMEATLRQIKQRGIIEDDRSFVESLTREKRAKAFEQFMLNFLQNNVNLPGGH